MSQIKFRAFALGSSLTMFGCGTQEIELRPAPAASAEPVTVPADGEVAGPEVSGSPDIGGETSETPASSNGAIAPVGPAPGMFDLPPAPLVPEEGCQKIDFLFVIDNSRSMRDKQANLARSFSGFIDVMQQVLKAKDFHIVAVSTDGDQLEEDDPTSSAEDCQDVRGAGKRLSAEGDDCGIEGGLSYMTDQQSDLAATFSCAAQVGTDGSALERPMNALLEATSATLNAAGSCNAGFLREDAVLVVTLITDEDDDRSDGDPDDWRRILLESKSGNEDALLVLGLVGDNNVEGGLLGGPCGGGDADASPRLQRFVDDANGLLGSVCAPDYTQFLQTAVGWIDSVCSDFVPPVIF